MVASIVFISIEVLLTFIQCECVSYFQPKLCIVLLNSHLVARRGVEVANIR